MAANASFQGSPGQGWAYGGQEAGSAPVSSVDRERLAERPGAELFGPAGRRAGGALSCRVEKPLKAGLQCFICFIFLFLCCFADSPVENNDSDDPDYTPGTDSDEEIPASVASVDGDPLPGLAWNPGDGRPF